MHRLRFAYSLLLCLLVPGLCAFAQKAHFGAVITDVCNQACTSSNQPYGVVVDNATGQVYFNYDMGSTIYVATPGAQDTYTVAALIQTPGLQLQQLARDAAGNLFASTYGNKAVYEFPKNGAGYGAPVQIGTSPFAIGPLAVDPATGTVFYLGSSAAALQGLMRIDRNAAGVYGTPSVLLSSADYPGFGGFAVDAAGSLYVTYPKHDLVQKLTRTGATYAAPVTVPVTFTNPNGIFVDAAGNLFLTRVNDTTAAANGVYEAVLSGANYTVKPLYLETNTSSNFIVYSVAADSAGRAYFGGDEGVLRRYNPQSPTKFGSVAAGASSAAMSFRFQIDQTVQLGTARAVATGVSGTEFTADLTQSTCSGVQQGTYPPVGDDHACLVSVTFHPAAPGLRRGAVQLFDNAGKLLATAFVEGVGTGPVATLTPGLLGTLAGYNGICASATGACGDGGTAASAEFTTPYRVAYDGAGNAYIADYGAHRVRKITAAGAVSTIAGTGAACASATAACGDGGAAIAAALKNPSDIAIDGAGNVFIADTGDNRVRRVDAVSGLISTVAGTGSATFSGLNGPAATAGIAAPKGIAVDGGGTLYIGTATNHRVLSVQSDGILRAFAGTGTSGDAGDNAAATAALLNAPGALQVDRNDDVYIADSSNNRVKKVTVADGLLHAVAGAGGAGAFAGDGAAATAAHLSAPTGLAISAGGDVFLADSGNKRVRKIAAGSGVITTVGGSGTSCAANTAASTRTCGDGAAGNATTALLGTPYGVALDGANNLLFAETVSGRIRTLSAMAAPVAFASTAVGSISAASTVTLANDGNAALTFVVPGMIGALNPSISANFVYSGSSTCPQIGSTSGGYSLAAGATCTEIVAFAPALPGTISGSAITKDNSGGTAGATQTIPLSGTGTSGTAATHFSVTAPATAAAGTSFTFTVTALTAANATATTYTGIVHFTSSDALASLPANAKLVNGTATFMATLRTVGNQTITATDTAAATITGTSGTIKVAGVAPTIAFTIPNQTFGAADFKVTATSNSTGAFTYTVTSGPATIAAGTNTVHLTGAGTVTVLASQAASGIYSAGSKSATFTVAKQTAAITFTIPNHVYGDADFTVTATSASTAAFTYTLVSGPATVTGNKVHITGVGTVMLKAAQGATANFNANSKTASFTVGKGTAAITFAVPNHTVGDADFTVVATSASTGAFTYSLVSGPATVTGNKVHLTGVGTVVLKASQASTTNYNANSTTATFTVTNPSAPITFSVPTHTFGDADFTVSASSASSGAFTYTLVSGPATVTGNKVHLTGAGTVTLKASQAAAGSYPANSQTATFTVNPGTAPISFTVAGHTFGDADFTVSASSASTGAFTYSLVSGPATVTGNKVHLTGAGSVTLRASQAAAPNYAASTQTTTFSVAKATPVVSYAQPAAITYGTALSAAQQTAKATGLGGVMLAGNFSYSPAAGTVPVPPSQVITATFTPNDAMDYSTASASVTLVVNPAPLTVTAANATRLFGATNPVFTGTVTGVVNGDVLTESFATTASQLSPVGTYSIVPSATGANSARYTQSARNGTLTIMQAGATASAIATATSLTFGQTDTITAVVVSQTSGTPTGTVQFSEPGGISGAANLVSGQAMFTVANLPTGTHTITATYLGDMNFTGGATATIVIVVKPQEFTLQATSASSVNFNVGQSAVFTLRLTPVGGTFYQPVHISYAADIPFYAHAALSTVDLPANSGATDVTFTITSSTSASAVHDGRASGGVLFAFAAFVPLLFSARARRRLRRSALVCVALLATCGITAGLAGCGAGYAAHSIPVTVTATSAGLSHSIMVTANVQQTSR